MVVSLTVKVRIFKFSDGIPEYWYEGKRRNVKIIKNLYINIHLYTKIVQN
jgi:hypothetical protein